MKCENCGNDYAKTFQITMGGSKHNFDSFECAINKLAPRCKHCGTLVIGHGVENGDQIYCCARCANARGVKDLRDHVD